MQTQVGEGKAGWDCHKEVGHGKVSLSTTPNALVPYPESPVPQWLKKIMKK
jgi:cytochrome c nitrite reductase small subunit